MKNSNTKEVTDLEVAKKMINIYQSAMDRKIEFNLSFDYVKKMLEFKTCYYTNIPFTEDGSHARSFDRIDSDKGYIEGNVVACNIDINGKKSNLTFDEIACIYHKLAKHKEPKVVQKPKPKVKAKPKNVVEETHVLDEAIAVLGQESVNKLLDDLTIIPNE
jgi:hypothetical protein